LRVELGGGKPIVLTVSAVAAVKLVVAGLCLALMH
jgi:hypothetical protein